MITLLKSFIIVLLLSFSAIQAQKVQLGLRLESNIFRVSTPTGYYDSEVTPTGLELNLAVYPASYFAIETRLGVEASKENFNGTEYGFFIRYYPLKFVYGVTGVMIHNNTYDSHNTGGQYYKTLVLPAIGIGINPGHFFFEVLYLYSGKKETGYYLTFDYPSGGTYPTYINDVWKIGVGFGITLFSF